MVPCAHAPQVQDDSSCSISTGPLGDTLTFRMPAASMGLSTLQQNSRPAALSTAAGSAGCTGPNAVQEPCAAVRQASAGADMSTAGLPHGWCSCCGAPAGSCCACAPSFEQLPGAVLDAAAAPTFHADAQTAACADSCAGMVPDESWDMSDQAGSCVVEGDVRVVVSHMAFVLSHFVVHAVWPSNTTSSACWSVGQCWRSVKQVLWHVRLFGVLALVSHLC